MKFGIGILGLLLAVGVVGFLLLQIPILSYRHAGFVPAVLPEPEYSAAELPHVESLRSPHAVLVLDVSGSMRRSDPQRLQAEAVLRFYATYADLAREILRPGDEARLAIVLFSTTAQIVDWTGTGSPWLRADEAGSRAVERVVSRYLGGAGEDPRDGQRTDYAAALERVKELVEGLETPPAVVFMTDGANDPDPLFSPVLSLDERATAWPADHAARRQDVEAISSGKNRFVSAVALPAPLDPAKKGTQRNASAAFLARAADTVARMRAELLSRRFRLSSAGPPTSTVWAPVFLGADADEAGAEGVRSLLTDPVALGGNEDGAFILCRDPRDLVGGFIRVLSRWFRLQEVIIPPGSSGLGVSREALAFALHLNTQQPGSSFELVSGSEVVRLQGRDGVWAGVAKHGGDWRFRTDGGAVTGGRLLVRPRYDWVLHSPRRMVVGAARRGLPLELHLVSLESEKPVRASGVYKRLPPSLTAQVTFEDGRVTTTNLGVVTTEREGSPAYAGTLSVGETLGRAAVAVDLRPLADSTIPVRTDRLVAQIELRPNVRLVFTGTSGRFSGVHVEGVPREGDWLRRVLSRRGSEPR